MANVVFQRDFQCMNRYHMDKRQSRGCWKSTTGICGISMRKPPPSYAYVDIEISMIKKVRQFTEWPLAIPVNLSFANFTFNSVKREKSRLTLNRAISSQYRVTGTHSEFFPQTPFRSFFRIIFETFLCILWSPPCEEVPAYRLLAGKQPAIVKVVHFSSESDTVFSNKVGEKTYMWHPRRT